MRNSKKRTIVALSLFIAVVTMATAGLTIAKTRQTGNIEFKATETAEAWASTTEIETVGIWDDSGTNIYDFTSDGGTKYVDAGTVIDTVDVVVQMASEDIVTEDQANARITLSIEDSSGTVIYQDTNSQTITSSQAGSDVAFTFSDVNFTVNEGDSYTITSEYQGLVS